jgi:hypothetical protein
MLKFYIFLLFPLLLFPNEASKKALAFYQSGDFLRAKTEFFNAYKEAESPEERAILGNNLAVLEAEIDLFEEAKAVYDELQLEASFSPQVLRQIYINEASLLHKIANQIWQNLTHEEELQLTEQGVKHLVRALEKLQSATLEDQRVAILEARDLTLLGEESIEILSKKVKTLLLIFEQKLEGIKKQQRTQKQLLEDLRKSMQASEVSLETTGLRNLSTSLENRFAKNWGVLQQNSNEEWKQGELLFKENEEKNKFRSSFNSFLKYQDYLQEGNLWAAKKASYNTSLLLSVLQSDLEQKDTVGFLLRQRQALVKKKKQSSMLAYQESLVDEHQFTCTLVKEYLQSISPEDPFKAELFQYFQNQLLVDDFPSKEAIDYDLAFYQQIEEDEVQTIVSLLETPSEIKTEVLKQKLGIRVDFEEDISQKTRYTEVKDKLSEENSWNNKPLLADVLLLLDPGAYIQYTIQQLQKEFEHTLSKQVFFKNDISQLIEKTQIGMQKVIEAIDQIEMQEELKKQIINMLTQALNDSVIALDTTQEEATFFLKSANQWLTRLLFLLKAGDLSITDWLKQAIAEEIFSLNQNEELQGIQRLKSLNSYLITPLENTQNVAIYEARVSLDKLNQMQDEGAPVQVKSLIQQGISFAEKVYPYLEVEVPELIQAYPKQNDALKAWEEALKKLNNEENSESKDTPQNEEGPSNSQNDKNSEDSQNDNQDTKEFPQELLELYQQMQEEDSTPSSQQAAPVLKQGLRPW